MSALVIVALGAEVALALVIAPAMGGMASAATASAATAAGLATRESRCLVELSTVRLFLGSPGSQVNATNAETVSHGGTRFIQCVHA
jgi:hypothetical protein